MFAWYVFQILCFCAINLIESFPIQDSYILYDVKTNGPLDEVRYKNVYQRLFYEQVTDEQLQNEGVGKRWVPPTLYSLLCVDLLNKLWNEDLKTKTNFFANGNGPTNGTLWTVFNDAVIQSYGDQPTINIPSSGSPSQKPWWRKLASYFFNPFKRSFHTLWMKLPGKNLFNTFAGWPSALRTAMARGWRWRATGDTRTNQASPESNYYNLDYCRSLSNNRPLPSDTILQLQKLCNDTMVELIIQQRKIANDLVSEILPNLLVSDTKKFLKLDGDRIVENDQSLSNNRTIAAYVEFDSKEIQTIVANAIQNEQQHQLEDILWAYRCGSINYQDVSNESGPMVFDEKSYAFSLFSGYFHDPGISPLALFMSTDVRNRVREDREIDDSDRIKGQPGIYMVPILKTELRKTNLLWYVPKVTLFESLISQGELIHMCSRIVYSQKPADIPRRYSFDKPYVVVGQYGNDDHQIRQKISGINNDSVILHSGRALDALKVHMKGNLRNSNERAGLRDY